MSYSFVVALAKEGGYVGGHHSPIRSLKSSCLCNGRMLRAFWFTTIDRFLSGCNNFAALRFSEFNLLRRNSLHPSQTVDEKFIWGIMCELKKDSKCLGVDITL